MPAGIVPGGAGVKRYICTECAAEGETAPCFLKVQRGCRKPRHCPYDGAPIWKRYRKPKAEVSP